MLTLYIVSFCLLTCILFWQVRISARTRNIFKYFLLFPSPSGQTSTCCLKPQRLRPSTECLIICLLLPNHSALYNRRYWHIYLDPFHFFFYNFWYTVITFVNNCILKFLVFRYIFLNKGKVIPLQVRCAQRVGRGIALLFHDRGTRRGWVVSSTPRPHFTLGKDPVPILQEAGWAPGSVWTGGKSRPHRDSIPDRPARSQFLYRLSYRATSF